MTHSNVGDLPALGSPTGQVQTLGLTRKLASERGYGDTAHSMCTRLHIGRLSLNPTRSTQASACDSRHVAQGQQVAARCIVQGRRACRKHVPPTQTAIYADEGLANNPEPHRKESTAASSSCRWESVAICPCCLGCWPQDFPSTLLLLCCCWQTCPWT